MQIRAKKSRKILTTCNHCEKNTAGTYARIATDDEAFYYCVSCYPLIAPALDFIDSEGLWWTVTEMLQHDESQREPGHWSYTYCDLRHIPFFPKDLLEDPDFLKWLSRGRQGYGTA